MLAQRRRELDRIGTRLTATGMDLVLSSPETDLLASLAAWREKGSRPPDTTSQTSCSGDAVIDRGYYIPQATSRCTESDAPSPHHSSLVY